MADSTNGIAVDADELVLIDSYPDALLAITAEGVILSWNHGAEVTFGFTREEAVGSNLLDLIVPPEAIASVGDQIGRAIASGHASDECVRRSKNGDLVYVDVAIGVIRDGEGRVRFLAMSQRDVTRLKYQREAQMLEQRFRGLLEAAPDAMVIVNRDGRIVLSNSKVEALFGYGPMELLGQRVEALIPERFHTQHPLHRGAFFEPRSRLMGASLDLFGRRKDASEFLVEISLSPMETEQGLLVTAAIRDITDRKKVEAKFRGLLEAAPDAMVIVDRGGRITLVNSQTEHLFGYKREELLGQSIELLVPDRFRDLHPGHRDTYGSDPHPRPMGLELFARRKDGTEVAVEISLSPLETEEGQLVTAAIRDITERKRHEEARRQTEELITRQAQEANRLKSEFLANMSHELRTPLNAIIGFAELMHDGKVGPVSRQHVEYLGDILTSSHHLLRLINDVLDLAKVEAGRMEFRPQAFAPDRVVHEVRDTLRSLAASHRVTVTTDLDPGVPEVVLDPAKLKQVLYNYLSNAIKFTPEEGLVVVRTRAEGADDFRVEVEDTGVGIQPQDLGRLFVEFQQLDAGVAKKHGGTGLGLALTRRIVEAQGGRVGVESIPGQGSRFHAVLPRVSEVQASSREPSHPPIARSGVTPGPRPTVLVVDDDPTTLKLVEAGLESAGYRVACVDDGETALRVAAENPPAAVILDLMMPSLDGFEFIERFRRTESGRQAIVIVWTIADLGADSRWRLASMAQALVPKSKGGLAALLEELRRHVPVTDPTPGIHPLEAPIWASRS